MHRRIGHLIASDQLVLGVRIHVVLVAKKALAMLLRPAGVAVLLAQLGGLLLPVRRRPTGLHGFVLVTAIALFRHRHNRGINHLPATRHVALRRKNAGRSARIASQPPQPWPASRGTATASSRPECCPRCPAAKTA